jgi:uncharacterized repeat protein (TIGR01451 family)
MPEEYINIELTPVNGTIRAEVSGLYPFGNRGYSSIDMYYPVPPDSENISVELDNAPHDWNYTDNEYPTIVGNFPMIRWTISPAPGNFMIETYYQHTVPALDGVYTLVYAMGTGKYLNYYSKQTTAYVTVRINFAYENLKVYADNTPIDNYETTVENGVTILTLTRTSEEFYPLLEDLIITFNTAVNTPLGENVQVTPTSGVSATFSTVTIGGNTASTTSTSGPPPPTGYEIIGIASQPVYYDITTTAAYSGPITICIGYDETQVAGPEADLRLMQKVDGWVDVTTSVDTVNNRIYGTTTSLSIFIVTHVQAVRSVEVSISPSSQSGVNGEALTYTVTVINTGNVSDNYSLTATDNAGWSPILSPTSLTISAGSSRTAMLSVAIPLNAVGGTIDNISVTTNGTGVSASSSCTAQVPVWNFRSVSVSISPVSKSGANGATLTYTVTVSNMGNVSDNYSLTVTDNASPSWSPIVSPTSLIVSPGSSDNATLSSTVPSSAVGGTIDNIKVTATSKTDNTVESSATCTAIATGVPAPSGGISPLVYVGAAIVIVAIIAAVLVIKRF